MTSISFRSVDFGFDADAPVFKNLSLELGNESPVLILGPSGCGKTTLLRLIAGLLKPRAGDILITADSPLPASVVFQEPRLLPWKTALENVELPLLELMGKKAAEERSRAFLRRVSMEDKDSALPHELSGGQRQRVNLARAFAFPGQALLMDEPFQSLDIPLRVALMDLTRVLTADFPRLTLMVTHDPREAVYLGERILVLGKSPAGIIHDGPVRLDRQDRSYGSAAQGKLEQQLLALLE
ncbi:MAG: ABC transporter ATP-binding protein [Treponema sp.]|jgi:NitT/TauT family transport system ATP-binding protein|nr:ABC transporter ATP-binding protein [Treponema sp.]